MSRLISLIVLIACIVIIGILFYRVMVGFFIPLFLAAVLVVVFRPLHRRVLVGVNNRNNIAALITTLMVTFIVLLPAAFVATFATIQGISLAKNINATSISVAMSKTRNYFNLQQPGLDELRAIDLAIDGIQSEVVESPQSELVNPKGSFVGQERTIIENLQALKREYLNRLDDAAQKEILTFAESTKDPALQQSHEQNIQAAITTRTKYIDQFFVARKVRLNLPNNSDNLSLANPDDSDLLEDVRLDDTNVDLPSDLNGAERLASTQVLDNVAQVLIDLDRVTPKTDDPDDPANDIDLIALRSRAVTLGLQWRDTRTLILGGTAVGFLRESVNPSEKQIQTSIQDVLHYVQPRIPELTVATGGFLASLGIGTAIMVVSLFFFLYDGPAMVRALMKLSPLDDKYELELLSEFDRVVRAIVLALIASAIVQGMTAGIGYYFAGMPSLVFLILLTTLCALIPFVGPAITWVPVCIYLAVYEERFWPAGLLALWGTFAVGSVDNIVKTMVLHGQSSLHPLFALLSIIGGLQALGPIGIVVGPIVVTLLQTLLSILQRELVTLDQADPIIDEAMLLNPKIFETEAGKQPSNLSKLVERLRNKTNNPSVTMDDTPQRQSNDDTTTAEPSKPVRTITPPDNKPDSKPDN